MFPGSAKFSMVTLYCSLGCQNVPHSLSNVLGVQLIAPRQGHHTNLDHVMGILGTRHGILGGGFSGAPDLVHDTLNWSTEANIAQRPHADNRDPRMSAGDP